jgi:hypothetical protein
MNLLPEKIIYYYHCYGVTIELEVPDSTWKPDDALLQTHIPGIEIHHANHVTQHNIDNSNKIKDKNNNNTYQNSSLQSLFWKLAHPDLTLHIKIEVTDSNKNTNNDNDSTLEIQYDDGHHQKHVRLSINNSNSNINSHSAHLKANTSIDSLNHLNIWKNDLPHFIYALLRQYWIETGLAPIHSLCAGNNLIIGHSGTGKSTLATELLTRHYPVFSLDRTLLHVTEQSLIPLAGTQVLSLRNNGSYNNNSIYNNPSHVSSHDFEVIAQNAERTILKIKPSSETLIPTSGIKIDIGIDDMAHSHNSYKDNKIQTIYLLNINDGEFKVNALSALSALHTLYPYFMDKIKEDIILGGGEIVFSGKISSLAQQQLIQRLKKMVESIPVMSLWGNAQDCAEYLIHSSQKR